MAMWFVLLAFFWQLKPDVTLWYPGLPCSWWSWHKNHNNVDKHPNKVIRRGISQYFQSFRRNYLNQGMHGSRFSPTTLFLLSILFLQGSKWFTVNCGSFKTFLCFAINSPTKKTVIILLVLLTSCMSEDLKLAWGRCCGGSGFICCLGSPHLRSECCFWQLHFWASFLLLLPGRQQVTAQILGPCHPCGRPEESSWLLVFA